MNLIKVAAGGQALSRDAAQWPIVLQESAGLMWTSDDASAKALDYDDAVKAVASMAAAGFGGFNDWRLPTVEELFFLADRSRCNPAIDTDFFPKTKSDCYWSSSPDASVPADYAWVVGFYYGSYCLHRGLRARVRAVRSVSPASASQ